jgi:serine acetyltransferase
MGTNACTIPGMKIGNNNKIVARLVIYTPIENDSTVMYRHKERSIVKKE